MSDFVMPALVAGIHVLPFVVTKDVDGRGKPGHDGGGLDPNGDGADPGVAASGHEEFSKNACSKAEIYSNSALDDVRSSACHVRNSAR
jgi:hypothetical protein